MAWKYFSVSTATWGDRVDLPAEQFTGGRTMNTGSSGSATFKMLDPKVAEVVTVETITPLKRVLVAEWNGSAVYAGFITDITEDPDEGLVTVNHTDIWWLWERRHILSVRGDGDQSAPPMTYSNRTLATLANLAVARGMNGAPEERYDLPVITNADVVGTHSRVYYGYEFQSVAEALQELMDTDGGPDIEFDVQWIGYPQQVRWVMRSGALVGGLWEWDTTAPKSEVSKISVKTDANKVGNKFIGAGEGSERNLLVRDASSFTDSTPALERVQKYQGIKVGTELQSRVNADLNASSSPVQQISFRIPADGAVSAAELRLGGIARVKTAGLLFLSDGWRDWRLIQFDFDRDWIVLQFQPTGG